MHSPYVPNASKITHALLPPLSHPSIHNTPPLRNIFTRRQLYTRPYRVWLISVERLYSAVNTFAVALDTPRYLGNRERRTIAGGVKNPRRYSRFWRPKGRGKGRERKKEGTALIASSGLSIIVTVVEETSIKGRQWVECVAVESWSENDSPRTRLRTRLRTRSRLLFGIRSPDKGCSGSSLVKMRSSSSLRLDRIM